MYMHVEYFRYTTAHEDFITPLPTHPLWRLISSGQPIVLSSLSGQMSKRTSNAYLPKKFWRHTMILTCTCTCSTDVNVGQNSRSSFFMFLLVMLWLCINFSLKHVKMHLIEFCFKMLTKHDPMIKKALKVQNILEVIYHVCYCH